MDDDAFELRTLMTRSVGDLPAPTDRLERSARLQGRGLRRRRRAGTALSGLVAAAAVTALAVTTLGSNSPTAQDYATNEPDPVPVQGEKLPHGVPGPWQMPAKEMLRRLTPVLPAGVVIDDVALTNTDHAPGESSRLLGHIVGTVTRDGVEGKGSLEVMLRMAPVETPTPSSTSTDADGDVTTTVSAGEPPLSHLITCPPGDYEPEVTVVSCTEVPGSKGTSVGRILTTEYGSLTLHEAYVLNSAGGLVYVATANTVDDKWGEDSPASADRTMLTADEVLAIARAATWTTWKPKKG